MKTPSPKVVFVGGSNLAFGIDCSQIEDSIGFTCVNMGLHAGQGLRFIMDDIDPYIKELDKDAGDVVVLMPEFEHFFGETSNGGTTTMGELLVTDPRSIEIMDAKQILRAFKGVPKQLTGTIMETLFASHGASTFKYLRSNFDEEGDEIGHLKMAYDNTRTPIPPHIVIKDDLNKVFCTYFKEKVLEWQEYATVVVFPETIYIGYVNDNFEQLSSLENELKLLGIPYYTTIDMFSYQYDKMFKAPDHITGDGVTDNSGRVGHLLKAIVIKE